MIVLFWGMFLTTPSLGISEDFDQTFVYSSVILALILSFRHTNVKFMVSSIARYIPQGLWERLAKVDPRQVMWYGMQWGIPTQQLKKLLSYQSILVAKRKKRHRKPRAPSLKRKKQLNRSIELYRKLPLNAVSRAWGKFNELELPVVLRRPLLGLYVWLFDCELKEALDPELQNYKNLGEFFRRQLRPDARNIDAEKLTSPADGKVLHYGVVKKGILEQVKGIRYSLKSFLGSPSWLGHIYDVHHLTDAEYYDTLKIKPENRLYHCVIYLAPGDYHRFHSATDWTVLYRRHFPGDLLSVRPSVAKWVKGLFNFNERAVYAGTWEHGFFSYTAVGATNVGSIKVYCDTDLETNIKQGRHSLGMHHDKDLRYPNKKGIQVAKGEMFGEFNLGSTIVLVFEAPQNFKFNITNDQKVKVGETLGDLK